MCAQGAAEARRDGPDPYRGGVTLKEAEGELIRLALERAGGNKSQAARELGISRQTLINRLKEQEEGPSIPGDPPADGG